MTEMREKKSDGGVDSLRETAEETKRRAAERGGEIKDDLKRTAEEAKESLAAKGEQQKDRAAFEIGDTASALDEAASVARDGSVQQQLLAQAAGGLDEIAGRLQGKDLGEMVGDIADFARERPAAFLGGAALAGFALARFAKASQQADSSNSSMAQSAAQPSVPAQPAGSPPMATGPRPVMAGEQPTAPTHVTTGAAVTPKKEG